MDLRNVEGILGTISFDRDSNRFLSVVEDICRSVPGDPEEIFWACSEFVRSGNPRVLQEVYRRFAVSLEC